MDDLEHRGLQLHVVTAVEVLAQGAHDGGADAHHVAGRRAGEEVELAAAHALLLGERDGLAGLIGPGLGQGAQGLRGDAPGGDLEGVVTGGGEAGGVVALAQDRLGEDGELAAAGGAHVPVDEEVVAEVHVGLEGGERGVALAGQGLGGQHRLQGGAGAVGQRDEAELAGVAQEDDAAGHAHDVLGLLAGGQIRVLLADSGDRGGDGELDGVGVPALGAQALTLARADGELLAGARLGLGLLRLARRGGLGGGRRGSRRGVGQGGCLGGSGAVVDHGPSLRPRHARWTCPRRDPRRRQASVITDGDIVHRQVRSAPTGAVRTQPSVFGAPVGAEGTCRKRGAQARAVAREMPEGRRPWRRAASESTGTPPGSAERSTIRFWASTKTTRGW